MRLRFARQVRSPGCSCCGNGAGRCARRHRGAPRRKCRVLSLLELSVSRCCSWQRLLKLIPRGFAILANVGICRQVNLSSNEPRIRAALKKWIFRHAREARSDYTPQRGFGQFAPEADALDRNLSVMDGGLHCRNARIHRDQRCSVATRNPARAPNLRDTRLRHDLNPKPVLFLLRAVTAERKQC